MRRLLVVLFLLSLTLSAQQLEPGYLKEMQWRCIGPFRGGRTVAISGVRTQPNVYYMAQNNGGVWKSTDYGNTWVPIFDDQPTQSIGALAVSDSDPNVIYVGSGEGLQRPDLSVGDGIYKSTDAGKTWANVGLHDARQIGNLIVDPKDPNRVFVAALGHPYGPNEERGVFRSFDGGKTWQKVLYKDENTGSFQVAFDPKNSNTIYAVLWAGRQGPWEYGNAYKGTTSGLFRSTDGGNNWTQLTKGLPSADKDGLGRIGLGIAPSDPSRIYALVDAPKLGGLYRSDDAGESWTLINKDGQLWGRGDDFAGVTVDPRNKDLVYVANVASHRSRDGGKTFEAFKGAPGGDDYHTIWINPDNPDIIFFGVDQGATLSVNGGQTWSSWYNQPTAQMFHVITDNRFPYWVYGAQQESGSAGVASRSDYGRITEWHPVGVEEYGYAAPDPLNPDIIYGSKGSRFDQATGELRDITPHVIRSGKYRYDRTAPMIFSPVDPHTLYQAAQVLFKTTNGGESWDVISPDLTRETPGVPASLGTMAAKDKTNPRGVIYSIGPSFKSVNTIWVGTDDGLIHLTRDGGKTWQNVTPPDLTPWSKVTQIVASHFDDNSAYASVSRFRLDELTPLIYRTHDGGKTWQKISNGLPDNAPVNAVREDHERKGLLFAATERGVHFSLDDGANWQPLRNNLPATSVRDIVIKDDDLVAGTHGRSFWILTDITPLRQMQSQAVGADSFLFKPQTAIRTRRSKWPDTPLPPEYPAGQNPPDGAIIHYQLKAASSSPVTLEVLDSAGKVLRKFSSADQADPITAFKNVPVYWIRQPKSLSAQAGLHRFVWDLRLPSPDSLEHGFPISAVPHDTPMEPQGAFVLPGTYTLRLTANGKSQTQTLVVKNDPRLKISLADLQKQHALELQVTQQMHDTYSAAKQAESLIEQIKKARSSASGDAAKALDDFNAKVTELASGGNASGGFGADPYRNLDSLNSSLAGLLGSLGSTDAAPTRQQTEVAAEVAQHTHAILQKWSQLLATDLPKTNAAAGVKLDPNKPVTSTAEADSDNEE
jgi:photosystem II stability/assembly factor-like uncharacterized protein